MATLEIYFDFRQIEGFEAAMEAAPGNFQENIEAAGQDIANRWRVDMAVYPVGPTYPVRWDSERQRRAFFASEGFGGGIPHVRQGGLPDSWYTRITRLPDMTVFEARTNMAAAKYVQDRNWQSSIHVGRWQTVQAELQATRSDVIERLMQAVNLGFQNVAARINAARMGD